MTIGKSAADRVKLVRGVYTYIRRVPVLYRDVDKRGIVRISLRTRQIGEAIVAAGNIQTELEALWDALERSQASRESDDAWTQYRAAVNRARIEGLNYLPAHQIATGELAEMIERLEILQRRENDSGLVTAVAGGISRPEIFLSEALSQYFKYSESDMLGKRPDQVRKWQNPRRLAIENFIAVLNEDKPIERVTRADARNFRDWWLNRIREEGLGRNACNKQLSHVSKIIRVVGDEAGLNLEPVFSNLMLDERKGTRSPFSREFVEQRLLAQGSLSGLNVDARCALLMCMETGMGPEEVTSLLPEHIRLNCEVPHVAIVRRDGAEQKTSYRERDIPLVGVALMASTICPNGIEKYTGKPAGFSSVANKFLRENDLLPSKNHSLYSLRHSFQDRLTAAEAPERLQADLMGHRLQRERYGKGATLAHKHKWLARIAYQVDPAFSV